ncbi:MAG: branched-chain amino acid ABC transporter permease [Actinobacteria bacterium]|nr:branched-chain amino acid ABC transporter permease [Actinomycetota bacterium]
MSSHKNPAARNLFFVIIFAIVIFILGADLDPYNQGQLAVVSMLLIGVLSVTLLTGTSGQISLGQGALMAVGGYASALTILNLGLSMWLALAIAIIVSAMAGLLLGFAAARLTGPYLAGTTLVLALALPSLANRFESVFGGDVGLNVDFGNPPILSSRTGRMWRAIRDNESAASLMGVNVSTNKIFTFVVSSGFAGLSGALYGLRGIVGPSVYPISLSLLLLTGAILGGLRSIAGALIGSALVVFLPDLIEWATRPLALSEQIGNYLPGLIGGVLLLLTVILNPGGIANVLHHHKNK